MSPIARGRRPSPSGPALLAVDVGNSETTIGVFQDEDLVLHWRLRSLPRTPDETLLLLRQLLAPESLDLAGLPSVLCSVVPPVTADFARGLERLTGLAPVIVRAETVPSMVIRYLDPGAVGPDRLANAVAVRELYGTPAIVVDLGTATTFDVVGEQGDYLGGAITPGLWVSAEELFRRAARLGRIELKRPERVIGRTTEESMQAGILLGHAGLVDAMVTRILHELGGRAHVVTTGGLASIVAAETATLEHVDEGLTLKGLRLIHGSVAHPEVLAAWTRKQESRHEHRVRAAAESSRASARTAARTSAPAPVPAPNPARTSVRVPTRAAPRAAPREIVHEFIPGPARAPAGHPTDHGAPADTTDSAAANRKRRRGRRGGKRARRPGRSARV